MTGDTRDALIYTRRSVLDNGKSVGDQGDEGEEDCAELGWRVVDTYTDNGRSASEFSHRPREDWSRLLADLRSGRGDALWLWESSRGDRKLTEWSQLLDYCHEHGVLIRVGSHGRTYDMANHRDWETLAEEGVRSAAETKKMSARVKRGVAGGVRAGKPQGRCPYGYLRVYDQHTKKFVEQAKDPAAAPVVERVVADVAAKVPLLRIAEALNAEGVASPAGLEWSATTVRRVAANEAYVARRTHRGKVHRGNWPPLVGEVTFAAAQTALAERGRTKAPSRPSRLLYELTGIATCAVCGTVLSVNTGRERKPGSGRAPHYWCRSRNRCVSVMLGDFDEFVTALTVRRLARKDLHARLSKPDDSKLVTAKAELADLQARLQGFYRAAAQGKLSPGGVAEIEAEMLPQVDAAREKVDTVSVPLVVVGLVQGAEDEAEIRARFERIPLAARRTVYRTLFKTLSVNPAGGRRGVRGYLARDRVNVEWHEFPTAGSTTGRSTRLTALPA